MSKPGYEAAMDWLDAAGYGLLVQGLASALGFGAAHLVWGFRDWPTAVNAVVSTTLLGALMAAVYLLGERSLAPCIVGHFIVTALIEPGMIFAAVEGRIGYWREKPEGQLPDVRSRSQDCLAAAGRKRCRSN